jgi:L-lactate dehydrogenase complex protein LldF
MTGARWVFARPWRLALAQRAAGALTGARLRWLRGPGWVNGWFGSRDMTAPARESFRAWWRRARGDDS